MANGTSMKTSPSLIGWGLSGSGVAALIAAYLLNVSNQASIAINVAEQHGAEINLIRHELSAIKLLLEERTHLRYTSQDAARDLAYIERRFKEIQDGCAASK